MRALGLLRDHAELVGEESARDVDRRLGARDGIAGGGRHVDGGAEAFAVGVGKADVAEGAWKRSRRWMVRGWRSLITER